MSTRNQDVLLQSSSSTRQKAVSLSTRERESLAIYRHASWLGIVAGLRSMTPLALLAWTSKGPNRRQQIGSFEFGSQTALKAVTGFLAVGEFIGDKLPGAPGRIQPISFIGRLTIGAVAGALIARRSKRSITHGAVHGASGALIGTVGGYAYRTLLKDITPVPDFAWAVIEDATALTLGQRAIQPAQAEEI